MSDLGLEDLTVEIRALENDEDINMSCVDASGGVISFPCDVSAPIAVSVAIGAGGLALLFVIYLTYSVSPFIVSPFFLRERLVFLG